MTIEAYLRTFKTQAHPCKVTYANRVGWVKFMAPSRKPRGENLIANLFRLPMFRFCANPGGEKGLKLEVDKLRAFQNAGEWVPEIYTVTRDLVWLSDLGETVESTLYQLSLADKIIAVKTIAERLALLHAKGLVHGAPMLRNIILQSHKVGWIDLEETPALVMPSNDAYARDLLLLVWSIAKCDALGADFIAPAVKAYRNASTQEACIPLRRVINMGSKVTRLFGWFLPKLGRDVAVAVLVIRTLKTLF